VPSSQDDGCVRAEVVLPMSPSVIVVATIIQFTGIWNDYLFAVSFSNSASSPMTVALNNLAYLLAETGGDLDDALTRAQRAKTLLPNLLEISDTLGWIYLKKNLTENAIDMFKELVTKEPNISTYHYHLGMAYKQKGDKTKALDQLHEALKYNPAKEEKDNIQRLIASLG